MCALSADIMGYVNFKSGLIITLCFWKQLTVMTLLLFGWEIAVFFIAHFWHLVVFKEKIKATCDWIRMRLYNVYLVIFLILLLLLEFLM